MITETKIPSYRIERHKYCDFCSKEITGFSCSKAVCLYCGKDLCEDCIGYEYETPYDYRTVYCKKCWEIGSEYLPEIEEHNIKISRLYTEWQDRCKSC